MHESDFIPSTCLFHGHAPLVSPLSGCRHCGGSGRVPYESDDFPPGTNACCCTCSKCREHAAERLSAVCTAAHIAPPNWNTLCGLAPAPDLVAYDFCSLPADDAELTNPEKWCPKCVAALHNKETT